VDGRGVRVRAAWLNGACGVSRFGRTVGVVRVTDQWLIKLGDE
jgi:hypothetical protein